VEDVAMLLVDRPGAARYTQLAIDVRQVELHGLLGHEEPLGDFPVRATRLERLEYRQLARAQADLFQGAQRAHAGSIERTEDRSPHHLPHRPSAARRGAALEHKGRAATHWPRPHR